MVKKILSSLLIYIMKKTLFLLVKLRGVDSGTYNVFVYPHKDGRGDIEPCMVYLDVFQHVIRGKNTGIGKEEFYSIYKKVMNKQGDTSIFIPSIIETVYGNKGLYEIYYLEVR